MSTKVSTKLVIILRADLGLSKGKLVSLGSRASRECYKEAVYRQGSAEDLHRWLKEGSSEVCLRVDSLSELEIVKEAAMHKYLLCRSVNTEEGETVCVAIGPNKSEYIDEVTGKLRLL